MITTTLGLMDESQLVKREDSITNHNEVTQAVEYCIIGCRGVAHITGQPDSVSCFCNQHVHRSVHVTIKKIEASHGIAASL